MGDPSDCPICAGMCCGNTTDLLRRTSDALATAALTHDPFYQRATREQRDDWLRLVAEAEEVLENDMSLDL